MEEYYTRAMNDYPSASSMLGRYYLNTPDKASALYYLCLAASKKEYYADFSTTTR
jgi:hypothetical protein